MKYFSIFLNFYLWLLHWLVAILEYQNNAINIQILFFLHLNENISEANVIDKAVVVYAKTHVVANMLESVASFFFLINSL